MPKVPPCGCHVCALQYLIKHHHIVEIHHIQGDLVVGGNDSGRPEEMPPLHHCRRDAEDNLAGNGRRARRARRRLLSGRSCRRRKATADDLDYQGDHVAGGMATADDLDYQGDHVAGRMATADDLDLQTLKLVVELPIRIGMPGASGWRLLVKM